VHSHTALPLHYNIPMGLKRHISRPVQVGHITIGGNAPIVVQSMTNTDTADIAATTSQCAQLAAAGSELVRITVNSAEAAAAVPHIRDRLDATATSCCTSIRPAPRRCPSTASIPAMWAAAPSAIPSMPR
jgi:hypothetical protein